MSGIRDSAAVRDIFGNVPQGTGDRLMEELETVAMKMGGQEMVDRLLKAAGPKPSKGRPKTDISSAIDEMLVKTRNLFKSHGVKAPRRSAIVIVAEMFGHEEGTEDFERFLAAADKRLKRADRAQSA
jgi:hypothetical protein